MQLKSPNVKTFDLWLFHDVSLLYVCSHFHWLHRSLPLSLNMEVISASSLSLSLLSSFLLGDMLKWNTEASKHKQHFLPKITFHYFTQALMHSWEGVKEGGNSAERHWIKGYEKGSKVSTGVIQCLLQI